MSCKKQYLQPTLGIERIEPLRFITASVRSVEVGSGTKSASESLSRRSSIWDDDDKSLTN